MWSKYFLPILSAIGFVLGIIAVIISHQRPPTPPIPYSPPTVDFRYFIAGEGLVEAASEDISIGSPFTEIVDEVFVEGGDSVCQGTPLFKLNTEKLEAKLDEALATLAISEAEYQKQLDLPRPEDVPPLQSRVKEAEASFLNRWTQFELVDQLENPKALSRDEYNQKKYAAIEAKASLEEAEDNLDLLLAGAWIRDLEISRANVKEARTKVEAVKVDIALSTIRAPIDGVVFRVNIRKGELAVADITTDSLILFGSVNPLHIRVDIDEDDAWRMIKGAKGEAFVRGNSDIRVPINYLRLEPFLVPKRNLVGGTTEQVDTRVLQVIYEFEPKNLPIYPGMLMDVYLEAKPNREAS